MADPYTTRDIDAHRPASPKASHEYFSMDTTEIWFAFTAGAWTKIYNAAGAVGGTGAANRVAYWSGASTLTSDADLTFDGTVLTAFQQLRVGTTVATSLQGEFAVGSATEYAVYFDAGFESIRTTAGRCYLIADNQDVTMGDSDAIVRAIVGGAAGGDPALLLQIYDYPGVGDMGGWQLYLDNSDSDKFKIDSDLAGGVGTAFSMSIATGETWIHYALNLKAGTAFDGTLTHAIGAARTWTLQDFTGTIYQTTGLDVAIADGGTGQSTATLAFNALDPLTTKGDIIVHNGTDSIRVAVGTDTWMLTADSATASGVKWAAAAGGGGAPTDATYVTLTADATLTNERVLTGTANQVIITDSGAGLAVTLSLPQNIHTAATPTFAALTLSGLTSTRIPVAGVGGLIGDFAGLKYSGGTFNVGVSSGAGDSAIELGAAGAGNRNSYIDLIGDDTYTDYGARLIRFGGLNGVSQFDHRGTGELRFNTTDAGPITFQVNGTLRQELKTDASVHFYTNVTAFGPTTANATAAFDVGGHSSGNRIAHIDLIGDDTYTDYGFRIIRGSGGANTTTYLYHRGTGAFGMIGEEASTFIVATSNLERFRVDSAGGFVFNVDLRDQDFIIGGDTLAYMFFTDATSTTENIALLTTAAPNWQTMDRGLFIGDVTTEPTGDPAAGLFLWSNAGRLRLRGDGLTFAGNYRFSHGTSALATTATEGFMHIQSCAGTPTGVPASIPTGQLPVVFDSTNLKLYFYVGGTWKKAQVTLVDAIYA